MSWRLGTAGYRRVGSILGEGNGKLLATQWGEECPCRSGNKTVPNIHPREMIKQEGGVVFLEFRCPTYSKKEYRKFSQQGICNSAQEVKFCGKNIGCLPDRTGGVGEFQK